MYYVLFYLVSFKGELPQIMSHTFGTTINITYEIIWFQTHNSGHLDPPQITHIFGAKFFFALQYGDM